MSATTITLEVGSPEQAALVQQFHGLVQEMQQLALSAPPGQVMHLCEAAVLERGQEMNARLLQQVVQQRIEELEKKGRRCVPALVVEGVRTVAVANGRS
jgi:hypothetical protein